MNPRKSWNLEKILDLGAWGLETTFGCLGHLEPKDVSSHRLEPWLESSQTGPSFLKNHKKNPVKSWNI